MDFINIGLYITYVLVAFSTLAAIVLPLINAFSNPKALMRSLVGLVLLGILFALGYALASGDVTAVGERMGISETSSQLIGGALILTYLLFGVSIIAAFFTEVAKIFK